MMPRPPLQNSRRAACLCLGRQVPARSNEAGRLVYVVGDAAILDRPKIALFCSVKCPGKLILDTYDLAKRFRDEGVTVVLRSPLARSA